MTATAEQKWSRLGDALACTALLVLACAQLWPGLSQGLAPPMSWDHGAHFGKAILTWERLAHGLRTWAPEVEAGVPLNTIYSPSGSLWVVLVRTFTPFLTWQQTYALAILGFRWLVGLAPYRLARVAGARPLGALVAGGIALIDVGDHSEGGFFYDVFYGVWPMSLAMVLFTLGLAEAWRALHYGPARSRLFAVLLLGASLFSHQMAMLALAIAIPVVLVAMASEGAPRRRLLLFAGLVTSAVLVAMWWLLPVLSWNRFIDDHGQLYRTWDELGAALGRGQPLLDRVTPADRRATWVGAFLSVATLWALLGRGLRRVAAVLAVLCFVVAARDWLVEGTLLAWLPPLGRIMYPRFMMIAKPMLFAVSGVFASEVIGLARRTLGPWSWKPASLLRFAPLLLLAPFVPGLVVETGDAWGKRSDASYAIAGTDYDRYLEFAAWMRAQPGDFFRVAYLNDASHVFQSAGALTGRPAHKIGMLIAEAFRNVSDTGDPDALRELGVKYVVTWNTPPSLALRGALRQVRSFGPIAVYELTSPDLREVVGDGSGEPVVLSRDADVLRVAPRGARELVVRRAFAPGWRAFADGRELAVREVSAHPDSPRLRYLGVQIPQSVREVTVRYDSVTTPVLLGWLLTMAGLVLAVALTWTPERVRERLEPALVRVEGVPFGWKVQVALAGTLVAMGIGAFLIGRTALRFRTPEVVVHHPDGRVETCSSVNDRGGIACQSEAWVGYTRAVMSVDGRLHACFDAHPPAPGRALRITFHDVDVKRGVGIEAGVNDDAGWRGSEPPIDVDIQLNERSIGAVKVPVAHAWVDRVLSAPAGRYDVSYVVRTPEATRRWFCFVPRVE